MVDIATPRRRGSPPGVVKQEPYYPDRVRKIVAMRDKGYTLKQVGEKFGITVAGAKHIIDRWGDWARNDRSN